MNLILRELGLNDELAFFEGMKEWQEEELIWYTFAWKKGVSFQEMLAILHDERLGINLQPNRVAHTMLYGFVDGKIIGRVSVRHCLNDYLRKRGGHIGYSVAEKFRKQGFATEMVTQALDYCRSLHLSEIMISCADTNIPSWKIIEKHKGILEDKVWDDEDNELIRRYWIKL